MSPLFCDCMDTKRLVKSVEIDGVECEIFTDFRDILEIFQIMNDPDLLDGEKFILSLDYFYKTDDYKINQELAFKIMCEFLTMGNTEPYTKPNQKPLFDWEQDFNIIVAPVNKIIGEDVRGISYLHWWTFLSAFMEVGECTFSTFVRIRSKINKGIKLDKEEEKIFKENRNSITLKKKYDSTTQALMDEILGRG